MRVLTGLLRGAAAGAAGTTAINASTYLDMVARGRPPRDTPERTVERAADAIGASIPGGDDARQNRTSGLGALTGIAAGVGTGAMLGIARSLGLRPPLPVAAACASLLAMVAGIAPMTALAVTDPRTWSGKDWAADVVPHLVYGLATASVLERLDP